MGTLKYRGKQFYQLLNGARVNPVIQMSIVLYCIIQANNGLTFGATGNFRLFVKVSYISK